MNKSAIISKVVDQLTEELASHLKAARASHIEATDPQSKAENKYDTRGLEAAYLARGQSKQAAEIENAIAQLQKLKLPDFTPNDPIDLGALIEIEMRGERSLYFLAPCAGGTEVILDNREIVVITPQSPLGQQLEGKKQGATIQLDHIGSRQKQTITSVA